MKNIHYKALACLTGIIMMLCAGISANAAQVETQPVSGSVTDENGEPAIGATVQVVETGYGTATDVDGKFTVNAPANGKLRISYIGYETQEVAIKGRKEIKITLSESTTALDEVVVVGYGTLKRKEMTSAISHVSAKDLNQISSLDASMLLQGKVSSVSVTNTALADPNSGGSIQIRGISSRNAGLGPLIVIDGVPGGDMTNVNPADIESIDVLKDGAASAIYGTRGSNGVILVNLKKGSRDNQVHTTYSFALTLNKAKKELDIMNAQEYRAYRTVANPLSDMGGDTDWFDAVTRLGVTQKHTLTLSGGNARTNFRITADYRDANGIDLRSDRREYGGRASINYTTRDELFTFTANMAPRVIDRNKSAGVYSQALANNPTLPIYDPSSANGYYRVPSGSGNTNIVEQLNEEENSTEIKLLEWSGKAAINILPLFNPKNRDMTLKSQIMISQYQVDKFNGWFTPSTYGPNVNAGVSGKASREFDKATNNNFEWVTNFYGKFKDHQIRAMAGYSYSYGTNSGMNAENWNFASDGLSYNNLGSGLEAAIAGKTMLGSYKDDHKLISFFGRVNYDWKERYMLSVSLRHEGSSRFGENHKWGNFPAVSVGWRISDESFMKGLAWIDDLKLRYDYGVTGNQDFGNYKSLATYRAFGWYQYNGNEFNVWGPSKNVNTELRWEKGHNQNVGIDFSLCNSLVTGSLNYFHRQQSDLLGDYAVSIPPNLFSTIYANVGTLRNTGFEFDITVNAVRNRNFTYSISLVGSTNDNKFVSFSNDVYKGQSYYSTCSMANPHNPGYLQRIAEGERIGNYYTYRYAGVDKNGDWLIYDKKGNIIPVAQGDEEDKTVTGNGLPKFTGSMTHNFTYRNFDLSVSLRGAAGFDIFNVHDFYFGLQSMTTNLLTSAYAKNAHITTGKNVITDYFIEPGDYLKIDNVTLGYTLNLNKRFIDKIRVFGTANNLYTFTRFTGIDPSVYQVNGLTPGTFGGSYSYYPSAFQFTFGLQVNF
ncbi:MAG: SusC/RagA family TonB-linked outer membrane protein [Muribaculaceae bacterium]|nr:SusC/RagA family TonB-linked outer membrane protein [Muribaculaceae bacterium]